MRQRLFSGTEDQVNDDVRREAAKLILIVGKVIPIALDLEDARGNRTVFRVAMENSKVLASAMQLGDQRCSDEAVAADEEDLHASTTGGEARRSVDLKKIPVPSLSHP